MKIPDNKEKLLIIPAVLSIVIAYFLYTWGASSGALAVIFVGLFISPLNKLINSSQKIVTSALLFFISIMISVYQISSSGYEANQLADEIGESLSIKKVESTTSQETEELSYTIESKTERPPIKATYNIRIPKRYEKYQIKNIANQIKASVEQDYENTFMFYLLEGSPESAGAYATSHYNPYLNIEILDLSESQVKKSASTQKEDPNVIGKFAQPYTKAIITIKKQGNEYIFNEKYPDGSEGDTKMMHKIKNGQLMWSRTFENGDGYYIIKNKNLVLIDEGNGMEMGVSRPVD